MRLARLVTPEGTTMEDWRIAAELAIRLGTDFGLETVDEVQDEIARVAPAYAGVDSALLDHARDGVVVPIAEHPDEIVLHTTPQVSAGVSWEPIRPTAAAEGDRGDETPAAARTPVPAPELFRWDRVAVAPVSVPPDAYGLRLVAARTLYDAGRTVASSPSLRALAPGPALVVHPNDLPRVGVTAEGDTVRVTSSRTSLTLDAAADGGVPRGSALLAWGAAAGELLDASSPVTDIRVETV